MKTSKAKSIKQVVDTFEERFRTACALEGIKATKALYLKAVNQLYELGWVGFTKMSLMYITFEEEA